MAEQEKTEGIRFILLLVLSIALALVTIMRPNLLLMGVLLVGIFLTVFDNSVIKILEKVAK